MKKKQLIKLIKSARRAATMENAGFPLHDKIIKEESKLYRETWIIGPLDDALKLLEEK